MLAFNRSVVCAHFARHIVIYTFAFIGGKEFQRKVTATVLMVFIHGYSYPFPIESSTQKNFTKKKFDVTPVGKPETASWENFISLLEKNFFSVGKLFFFSWALSEAHFDAFLFVFDLLWLLSMNTKNVLRLHFCFDKRNILSNEQ